jgi:hypothetical protein
MEQHDGISGSTGSARPRALAGCPDHRSSSAQRKSTPVTSGPLARPRRRQATWVRDLDIGEVAFSMRKKRIPEVLAMRHHARRRARLIFPRVPLRGLVVSSSCTGVPHSLPHCLLCVPRVATAPQLPTHASASASCLSFRLMPQATLPHVSHASCFMCLTASLPHCLTASLASRCLEPLKSGSSCCRRLFAS